MLKSKDNHIYKLNSLNNNEHIIIKTKLLKPLNNTHKVIYVNDTENFKEKGIITINNEQIYYENKSYNKFYNITRAYNNSQLSSHMVNETVSQELIHINNPKNGIFIDNAENATFVLSNNNCVKEGTIRFVKDEQNPENNKFQGCVYLNKNNNKNDNNNNDVLIKWVDFNALKGEKGDTGSQSNNKKINSVGDGISLINNDTNQQTELLSIKPKKTLIDGSLKDTISITKENNTLLFEANNIPYVYDFTQPLTTLKNTSNGMLNSWGKQVKIKAGDKLHKGQMVLFTNTVIDNNVYVTASPIKLNESNKDKFNKKCGHLFIDSQTNSNLIMGLCCNDCNKNDIAYVLTDGYGLIKIGNNLDISSFSGLVTDIESSYIGSHVYMDSNGYGFICNDIEQIEKGTIYCGGILETNNNLGFVDNYVLIKFEPKII